MRQLIFCVAMFGVMSLFGQGSYLEGLDARDLPDTTKINLLNDHAWELARTAPDSAEALAQEAIARSTQAAGFPKGLINAYILLGIVNKDRGYYGISVEHYLRALQLAEGTGDSLRVSGCLNNLGSVFYEQGNYQKSLSYFQRSLAIENKLGKDKGQASIRLVNIGDAYFKLDSLDKAAAFYYNSLLIEEELKNEDGMFYARIGIGRVDTRKGNHANAQSELDRAMGYAQHLQNHPGICEAHIALGELHLARQDLGRARVALDSALAIARRFQFQGLEIQALGDLHKVLKAQGDLVAANEVLEQYYTLRENLNSATVNSRIGELQMRYELEKKEQEIALFRKNEELQVAEVRYERKLRNYLLFSVGVTLLLVLYNLYRARRTENGQ